MHLPIDNRHSAKKMEMLTALDIYLEESKNFESLHRQYALRLDGDNTEPSTEDVRRARARVRQWAETVDRIGEEVNELLKQRISN